MGLPLSAASLKAPALYLTDGRLSPDDEHYLRRVLRLRPGQRFLALDGRGGARWATLSKEGLELGESGSCVPEAALRLHVFLALSKGERFDRTLEKLAELGVASVTPLSSERTQVRKPGDNKRERWQRIALSGSALALRGEPMQIKEPLKFQQALKQCGPGLIFSEGAPALKTLPKADELALFIGPEGGFSDTEIEQALDADLSPAGLGPRNLRVETAAVAAATLALFISDSL